MKRLALLAVAVASAVAAPAMADSVRYYGSAAPVTTYVWDPATGSYIERHTIVYEEVPADAPAPVAYSATSDVTYNDEIVVVAPRANEDDLIAADVADRIASDPRIGGTIGVDSYRNNVTLTGRVATQAQADRAERHAHAADGVRDVNNTIRASVGQF